MNTSICNFPGQFLCKQKQCQLRVIILCPGEFSPGHHRVIIYRAGQTGNGADIHNATIGRFLQQLYNYTLMNDDASKENTITLNFFIQ